jgi:DNA-binding MarR family transcriptional regulator
MTSSPTSAKSNAPFEQDLPAEPHARLNLDNLSGLIAFHLRLAAEASQQAFSRKLDGIETNVPYKPGHLTVLTLIANNPGVTQTAISSAAGRDKSTLTPMLNEFVRRGLVRRESISTDRRSYALSLTGDGEAALAAFGPLSRDHEARLNEIIGPENKAEFIRILCRIKEALG